MKVDKIKPFKVAMSASAACRKVDEVMRGVRIPLSASSLPAPPSWVGALVVTVILPSPFWRWWEVFVLRLAAPLGGVSFAAPLSTVRAVRG